MTKKEFTVDHSVDILNQLNQDRKGEKKLCDITVRVESRDFPVHKCILVVFSLFFKKMFLSEMREKYENKGIVQGVSERIMEKIINFIYTGKLTLTSENVFEMVEAADYMQIIGLKDLCMTFLCEEVSIQNCLKLSVYGKRYGCDRLVTIAEKSLQENFESVLKTEEIKHLEHKDMSAILQLEKRKVSSEESIYDAIINWIKHDVSERAKHLKELVQWIKVEKLSWNFLHNTVLQEGLVMASPECVKRILEFAVQKGRDTATAAVEKAAEIGTGFLAVKGKKVFKYDSERREVIHTMDLLYDHEDGSAVKFNDAVYVISGDDTSSVERFSLTIPASQSTEVASLNEELLYAASTVCGDYIYTVGGGWPIALSSGQRYDLHNNSWEKIADMNERRTAHALVSTEGRLYSVGGWGLNAAECYDPRERSWRNLPPMRRVRWNFSAVVCNNAVYAIGGYHCGDLACVEKFDIRRQTWNNAANMNVARQRHGACLLRDKIYVAGGEDVNVVESYDPQKNLWQMEGEFEHLSGSTFIAVV